MRRIGRTQLFSSLHRAFSIACGAGDKGATVEPLVATRRGFMNSAVAGLMATYACSAKGMSRSPTVAIVGAGIAGLNATYLLAQAGYNVRLFEGSDSIGGRIRTDLGSVAPDVYTEIGGEFIDSGHDDMLALAQHFGLSLIDTRAQSEADLQVAYFANGRLWSEAEVIAAFKPLARSVLRDLAKTSDDITYDSHSGFDSQLDHTDAGTYIKRHLNVEWLYSVMESAYVNEFGLELQDQSSLNFLLSVGTSTAKGLKIYGISDQRFKVRGGNDQITAALASAVCNCTELNRRLTELGQQKNGQYSLTFVSCDGHQHKVNADFVVLCIPFSVLRNVKLTVPLPVIKQQAIQELGYGVNAKLILGCRSRNWRRLGFDGDSYADLPFQSGWDSSRLQGTSAGAYTIYAGGNKALALEDGSAKDQAERLLPGLNRVFPGIRSRWLGTALRAYWPANPYVLGSYSAYKPGQWTGIRGAEGFPVDNLYFAGEHTSLNWQGYMNGGAETGRLAAEALFALLG